MQKFYAINNFNLFIFIYTTVKLQSTVQKIYSMQITIITTTTYNQTRTVLEVYRLVLGWVVDKVYS